MTENYNEEFTFIYNAKNELENTKRKNEKDDFLPAQMPAVEEDFKNFRKNVILEF